MNFLQIVQLSVLECGVSGSLTTVAGQVGGLARVVSWVGAAWEEVQTEHDDWRWMRSSNLLNPGTTGAQFVTVAGQASYPLGVAAGTCGVASSVFGKWAKGSFRNYTTTVGVANETFMDNIGFDAWRNAYMYGAMRSVQTRPIAIAVGPDESLCVGPPSNGLYTVTGDYFTAPTEMTLDADTPTGLPAAFHRIIVYKTMELYGGYEAAPEVFQKGQSNYRRMLSDLEHLKLPQTVTGGALA